MNDNDPWTIIFANMDKATRLAKIAFLFQIGTIIITLITIYVRIS